ncbi:type II toxin-antitoxin system PemK/MazF family toxin [Candidatus Saccharibacteria bacterium]|nr:type II toxin-antitoxin system PemK/MazF family toxin [Candidatus Saccharibacteria bacterium]
MNEKNFDGWMDLKEELHSEARMPRISEGEIWWCAIGENVGVEINGKSNAFSRPVLVLKKFSKQGFLCIPLTSQKHEGDWYAKFIFQGKEQHAALCQSRTISVSRLYKKLGDLPESDYDDILCKYINLILKKKKIYPRS